MINFISIYKNESLLIQIVSETIVALLRYFDKLLAFIFRVFIPISFQLVSHETGLPYSIIILLLFHLNF